MKRIILPVFLLTPFLLLAQLDGVVYPKNFDTKFQDVYVDGNDFGYAVGTCGVVAQTQDAGVSWTVLPALEGEYDFYAVTCPNDDCSQAVIGGEGAIFKRQSNGSFSLVGSGDDYMVDYFHQLAGGTIIGDGQRDQYLRTTDGGSSWTVIPLDVLQGNEMAFGDNNTGYYMDNEQALRKTTDAGLTWSTTGFTLPGGSVRTMYFRDADNGWFQEGSSRSFWRTTDGGVTWTDLEVTDGPRAALYLESFSETHLVCLALVNDLWTSMDGGATWTRGDFPTPQGTRPGFYNYHRRGDEFFIPSDAGEVFYSPAGFTDWETTFGGNRGSVTNIEFGTNELGVAVGFTGFSVITRDGGDTWEELDDVGGIPRASDIFFLSDDTFVILYSNADPRISRDGGNTFSTLEVDPSNNRQNYTQMERLPSGRLYLHGFETGAYSDDEGESWTLTNGASTFAAASMAFISDQVGFAGGLQGQMSRTLDGGLTWTDLTKPSTSSSDITSLYFTSADEGYVATSTTQYRTTDGGQTWTMNRDAGGSNYRVSPDGTAIYAARYESGNNGTFRRSTDGGQTFEVLDYSCAALRGGGLTPDGKFFFTGGDGGHIRKHDIDRLVPVRNNFVTAKRLKVYPNPAAGQTTLELPVQSVTTRLSIFSADGRQVQQLNVPAGTERFRVDLLNLNPGLYLLSWVGTEGERHTGRLVVR
ncbi:YCF48-related protein [Lewinella sp. W8]|uniref:YCF48-related protein n=1 Tax=Lewinella sp. W8 TaxID=2528208 RepID=UPI001067DB37|nr:YCF48-related protein [Lewinella sp. W8]MTB52513.1 T9SS type A sorting domain-containing protein [Lewinella sp. W8]